MVNKLLKGFWSHQKNIAEDKQNESERDPSLNFRLEVRNNSMYTGNQEKQRNVFSVGLCSVWFAWIEVYNADPSPYPNPPPVFFTYYFIE